MAKTSFTRPKIPPRRKGKAPAMSEAPNKVESSGRGKGKGKAAMMREAPARVKSTGRGKGKAPTTSERLIWRFTVLFGDGAHDDKSDDDSNSGDDVLNDDDNNIPDPYSSEEEEEETAYRENEDPNDELVLGRTFASAHEFKLMLLRYSLKSRYDINFYKSSALRIGAKCSDVEGKCDWRVYCSYERRKRKLMIKCLVKEHVYVRSGYTKMLKRSTIAHLFSERLRLNPKLTKQEWLVRSRGNIVSLSLMNSVLRRSRR